MKSAAGRFAMVPEWLLDADVSCTAIRLYAVLAAKYADRQTGACQPGRRTLADDIRAGVKTVDRAMRELATVGAIAVEHRQSDGAGLTSNRYTLATNLSLGPTVSLPSPQKCRQGRAKNVATVTRISEPESLNQIPPGDAPQAAQPDPVRSKPKRERKSPTPDDLDEIAAEYAPRLGGLERTAAKVRAITAGGGYTFSPKKLEYIRAKLDGDVLDYAERRKSGGRARDSGYHDDDELDENGLDKYNRGLAAYAIGGVEWQRRQAEVPA